MVQVLHGRATTTAVVRQAIQNSQESLRGLAARYGINQKTVAKWKKRSSVADLPTGPTDPKSTSLTLEDEAIVVVFRRHTLLPLNDCFYALQATIPHLTRSSLHRCLRLNGIESFWSNTKRRLARFSCVKTNFELHLKECEWRCGQRSLIRSSPGYANYWSKAFGKI